MQFSLTSTIAIAAMLMSTLTTAVPLYKKSTSDTSNWPVSGFTVGCSPAACVYNFTVSRAAGPSNPAFNTTCTGNDFTSDYTNCTDSTVSARIVPETGVWQVDVLQKYATDDEGGFIEAWANATVDESVSDFMVTIYQTDGTE
jgi:hypothetical protein